MDHSKSDFTQGSILKKLSLFFVQVLQMIKLPLSLQRLKNNETQPQ